MKNEENKKLGRGDENAHINLRVIGSDEEESLYRIKRSTQFKKLMNAYCNRKCIDPNSVMFSFNGCHLQAEQTPFELDMKDDDEIDAISDGSHDFNHKMAHNSAGKDAIKHSCRGSDRVRDKCSRDLDSHIAEIRTAKLSELSSLYESKIKEALYGPVEALLKGGKDDTWPAIRNLLHQETAKGVSEISCALSGFEVGEQEKEDIISNLKSYAKQLVEGKAREEAGKVLYHMKESGNLESSLQMAAHPLITTSIKF